MVTYHPKEERQCYQTILQNMKIMSMPDPLLVYTGCKTKEEFSTSIVHISFAFDYLPQLKQDKFCSVNGTLVFRHPTSLRTAIMSIISEKILLETGEKYSINKINNIAWQDDDAVCEFLGILEAKIRLDVVKYTETSRNDRNYYAIAVADVNIRESMKDQLKFLRCELGVNIVYKEHGGTRTRRSILLPTSLINVDKIVHNGIYCILVMKPLPTLAYVAPIAKELFGIEDAGTERGVNLDACLPKIHDPKEVERITDKIVPSLISLVPGETYVSTAEFLTTNGPVSYEITNLNIGRSCLAITAREISHTNEK